MSGEIPASRSRNMSRIRGSNTEPELLLRKALHHAGFRGYRLNIRTPGGRGDIVWPSRRWAIFIDGCFWHGCPEHYVMPRSNGKFWREKLRENVSRDSRQTLKLINEGWVIVRLWEHEVRIEPARAASRTVAALKDGRSYVGSLSRVIGVEAVDGNVERRELTTLRTCGTASRFVLRRRSTHKTGRRSRLVLANRA